MLLEIVSGIAAFLSVALAAYLLKRSSRTQDRLLAAALVMLAASEVIDRFSLSPGFSTGELRNISQVLEAAAAVLFVFFSYIHARSVNLRSLPRLKMTALAGLGAVPFIILFIAGNDLFYSPDLLNEEILFLNSAGYWYYLVLMGLYILSIVQV